MSMFKIIPTLLALTLLTACATKNRWKNPQYPDSDSDYVLKICENEANTLSNIDTSPLFRNAPLLELVLIAGDSLFSSAQISKCMEDKGYIDSGSSQAASSNEGSHKNDTQQEIISNEISFVEGDTVYPRFPMINLYPNQSGSAYPIDNLRSQDYKVLGLKVLSVTDGWLKVSTSQGKTGWVDFKKVKK